MKKIYSYFLIAMAAAAVVSCVKEELGNETPVTPTGLVFTVQNETVVKSVLDENITPEWVDGDEISVNGTSCALLDAAAGTFDGANVETAETYRAVYPYAADNVFTDNVLSATVPAEQVIAAGQNVAQGALVAACISDDTTLKFKNCVSLMQIDLPIEGVKEIIITVDGETEVLAGPFTMDLAAETLAPVASAEGTSKTVTLKAAEGTFAPGTYYAAVLPGTFSGFSVKFIKSEEDTQTIASKKELLLERSNGKTLGTIFTYNIGTAEQLISWAKNNAKYTSWDVVNLTANIDLTAEQAAAYIEADEFCGTFNGNNKKITGLTTPLFGDLRGIVKNVDITANIVHNGASTTQFRGTNYGLGILAHYLYADKNANASVSGVTTRGSIKASFPESAHNYFIGGLAGSSNGVPMTDCTNYASISTENITITGTNYCCVGGVVGRVQTASTSFTNCDNHGAIDVQSVSVSSPVFGGVFGQVDGGYTFTFTDCDNMAESVSVGNMSWSANLHIGGVLALSTNGAVLVMTDCDNSSYVKNYCSTSNSGTSNYSHLGGILGVASASKATLTNCKNSGKIENATINANGDASKGIRHCIGGIVGRANNATTVDDCDNSGEVCATADKGYMFFVGGITGEGSSALTIEDCDNTGKVSSTATSGSALMGGVSARLANGGSIKNSTNNAKVTLAGTVLNGSSDTGYQSSIAGIVGAVAGAAATLENCKNLSAAVVDNASKNNNASVRHSVGGMVGRCVKVVTLTGCTNEGKVTSSAGNGLMFNIGGMTGYSDVSHSITNCVNGGEISASLKAEHLALGGISGRLNVGGTVTGCTNNGLISLTGTVTNTVVMGGMIGYNVGKCPVSTCTNNGIIKNESATTATGNGVAIGGIIGRSQGTGPTTITSCHNTTSASLINNVTGGATLKTIDMGGMVGFLSQNSSEIKTSTVNSTLSTTGTTSTTRIHALVGNIGGSSIKLTSNQVAGTVNGTTLTADNYAGLLSNGTVTATGNSLLQ